MGHKGEGGPLGTEVSDHLGQNQHHELQLESFWKPVQSLEQWNYVFLATHADQKAAAAAFGWSSRTAPHTAYCSKLALRL